MLRYDYWGLYVLADFGKKMTNEARKAEHKVFRLFIPRKTFDSLWNNDMTEKLDMFNI